MHSASTQTRPAHATRLLPSALPPSLAVEALLKYKALETPNHVALRAARVPVEVQ